MDPARFRATYERIQSLDDRLTYKVRPRGGGLGLSRPSADQLEEKMRDLAEYTVELKEILAELMESIAAKPGGSS